MFDHDFGQSPLDTEDELKDLEGAKDDRNDQDDRGHSWLNELTSNDGGYDFRFNDTPLRNVSGIYSNVRFLVVFRMGLLSGMII